MTTMTTMIPQADSIGAMIVAADVIAL